MFMSVQQLEMNMGVNEKTGRFFVDRKPPQDNIFWKDKLLYIGVGNGYISIPVYYDILHRIGLPLEILLDERHVQLMESLMHFAMLHEKNEITKKEELTNVRALLTNRVKDPDMFEKLNRYLDQHILKPLGPFGTVHPSLNRADVFLYVLCDLPLSDVQWGKAIRYWYALHPSYLIFDDVRDYEKDKEDGEENVVMDLGEGEQGFKKTFELLRRNGEIMQEINPLLADFLTDYEEQLLEMTPLKR